MVSATALAVPVADPPPHAEHRVRACRGGLLAGRVRDFDRHVRLDSGERPRDPVRQRRGEVPGDRLPAPRGDQQQPGYPEPGNLTRQRGPRRTGTEHHPAGQRVTREWLHQTSGPGQRGTGKYARSRY